MKIFLPIILLTILEVLIITKVSSSLHKNSIREDTIEYALRTIEQYKEIRQYYSNNIISKVLKYSDLKVDSNHKNTSNTIPLPATFIHDLSENITKNIDGIQIKLYSDYSFANRENKLLDTFGKKSISYFRKHGTQEPLISDDIVDGVEVVRVAIGDVMNDISCVNCHNTRLDTPKKDWKLGDIRGVIEVIIPVQEQGERYDILTGYIDIMLLVSGLLLAILIYLIVSYFTNSEKKRQEDLKEKQYKLNKTVRSFGQNVIASNTDLYGFITYVSKAFCDISGYSEKELIGRSHNIVRHPDMPKELYKDMWKSIKNGQPWEGDIKNKNKAGEFYWVRSTLLPDYDYNRRLVGYSSIRHDITAQKVKEEFFSNMSHELRTPLNAILGFSNILNKQISDKKHREYLGHIDTSSKQLLNLINDILDLSKIKTGEFTIEPHEFNAYDELQGYSKQFECLLSEKEISFQTYISNNLKGIFVGDWFRISQIILNLLSNAIKFTPEGGTITLDIEYIDENFSIVVKDTGIGMPMDVQDKIFKPFVQADGSTTRKYGGTGLGLSITQKLIELMNGELTLDSKEGKGSIFTVRIPLKKTSSNTIEILKADADEVCRRNLRGKVLVAEDNKTNQILIELLLEEIGVECDIVGDGEKALQMYDPDIHKLILMDENMPNMNGITSMHIIKETHGTRCGPIIALTANVMEGDRERFLKEGMDEYLSKPINETQLYDMLKKFLKD
ncbi:ATP-binding protein [Sulfurimonas sp. CS5]|uniref:ATP-binding protein n=1 Tax=Sulfurimonas sp. CS5 TaxID=3391145 RepID=UPI0039EC5385